MHYLDVFNISSWRLPVLIIVVTVITQPTLPIASAQDASTEEAKTGDVNLAASLLDGLLQNNRAISSFDVTFDADFMVHRPGEKLTTSHLKVRYCQREVDQGLFVRSRTADQFDPDQEVHSINTLAAFYLNSKPNATSIDATGKNVLKFQSTATRNQRIGIPAFHSIGFLTFPHVEPFLPRDDPHWTSLTIPNDDITAFVQGPRRAKVVEKRRSGDKVNGISIWIFDLETLLPDQRTYYYFDLAGEPKLKEVEDYTWKAFAGVNVPVRIRAEVKQIAIDKDSGEHLPYSEIYNCRFDWNSVNAEISKELFVWENATSMKEVQSLLSRTSKSDDVSER